ncbi:hypothetical protein PUV54_05845 [Hyphococcus flavus]|uniref:Uncharacterized protein n=1 Tax=Hyphococcus flavus TaxID=1866326 RepID=A0AAE9ZH65_9PROT|nr:hypothetical protein [Hyphococcus flavus]WDI32717.1 hypothetical protein PUV54_05845 [Hyphococcus flavus]
MTNTNNKYEQLAIEACELGKALWVADLKGNKEKEMQDMNRFMFKLVDDVRAGKIKKRESVLIFLIIQIVGFTAPHKLTKPDDMKVRMETARKAIEANKLSDSIKRILNRMIDLMEDSYFADESIKEQYFQIERQTVPDYLFDFYQTYLTFRQAR